MVPVKLFHIILTSKIDEYLYLAFVGTKHIKTNDKRVLEALIQRYCLHGKLEHVLHLQSMKTIGCRYVGQQMCLLMHFCYSKIYFHQLGWFELNKNNVEIFKCF